MKKCLLALKVVCSDTLNRWMAAHSECGWSALATLSLPWGHKCFVRKEQVLPKIAVVASGALGCRQESGTRCPSPGRAQPAQPHVVPEALVSLLYSTALPWDAAKAWVEHLAEEDARAHLPEQGQRVRRILTLLV